MRRHSEENGVDKVIAPEKMIDSVHRVRGGALFELSIIAPKLLEPEKEDYWGNLNEAIYKSIGVCTIRFYGFLFTIDLWKLTRLLGFL